jgi:hypothetical protein
VLEHVTDKHRIEAAIHERQAGDVHPDAGLDGGNRSLTTAGTCNLDSEEVAKNVRADAERGDNFRSVSGFECAKPS